MNFNGFIGLPYRDGGRDRTGVDCWGLVRLVLRECFDVEVPAYAEGYEVEDRARVESEIEAAKPDWIELEAGQERPGDVILLNILGVPTHVGLVVGKGQFLHVRKGHTATIESYRGGRAIEWRNRVVGFYRWRDLHA